VLTPACKPIQLVKPGILETKSLNELGGDVLFDRATVGQTTDRYSLHSRRPLEHLTGTVNAVVVRNHDSCNDRLAKTPARFDHPLVGAGNRHNRD